MPEYLSDITNLTGSAKIIALIVLAVSGHIFVKIVQWIRFHFFKSQQSNRRKTIASLTSSIFIFSIYFITIGITLQELGVSLGTYIASASVIGIAVGFGTQNVVQDVINGLTILLTNLFTLDDMVEISGQTGIVKEMGMRFVVLQSPMGAKIYIPTRTVTNVINYPRGYIRCLVDISLYSKDELEAFENNFLSKAVISFTEQFPGILRAPPEIQNIKTVSSGKHYIRIKFRIWPGRGLPIETSFKKDVVDSLKTINADITDSAVSVNYEVAN